METRPGRHDLVSAHDWRDEPAAGDQRDQRQQQEDDRPDAEGEDEDERGDERGEGGLRHPPGTWAAVAMSVRVNDQLDCRGKHPRHHRQRDDCGDRSEQRRGPERIVAEHVESVVDGRVAHDEPVHRQG